jgi:DUF4097 and DUF4098 domain-containing protein YvlB
MFNRTNAFGLVFTLLAATSLGAQQTPEQWLERCRSSRGDGERHCELREYTLAAPGGVLLVSASANGGVTVTAASRSDVKVVARVETHAKSISAAENLAREVQVALGSGEIRSSGPKVSGSQGWSISYEVWAPAGTSLRLRSVNGSLATEGMTGDVDAETTNGGIHLNGVRGAVAAKTTNGGVDIEVAGGTLGGVGIGARTTNGGITLMIPENFGAKLTAKAVNGGITVGFPVQVAGKLGRNLETTLGGGGPPISLETVNGGVTIRRP